MQRKHTNASASSPGKQRHIKQQAKKQKSFLDNYHAKKQAISNDNLAWRSMIDLKDQHLGPHAYDSKDLRDDILGAQSTFLGNLISATAYAETFLIDSSNTIDRHAYDMIHRLCMKGAVTKPGAENPLEFRNSSQQERSYGFPAGSSHFLDAAVIAQAWPSEHERQKSHKPATLHGMKICNDVFKPNKMPEIARGKSIADFRLFLTHEQATAAIKTNLAERPANFEKGIPVEFPPVKKDEIKNLLDSYFKTYNTKVLNIKQQCPINQRDKILFEIAALFQKLERLHPYPDGNGRVNQIILQVLLQKEGFPRTILDDPSCSHLISTERLAREIKKGMHRTHYIQEFKNTEKALLSFDKMNQTPAEYRFKEANNKDKDKIHYTHNDRELNDITNTYRM